MATGSRRHWSTAVASSRTWVYGGLRVADGQAVTLTAPSRNSANYQRFLALVERTIPDGEIAVVTDNLSSHTSVATREWLAQHPRIRQAFIPKGACWLNLQEGWWRLFRRQALAGQCFADSGEIALAPGPRPGSSTSAPGRGCGDDHHHHRATGAASSPTAFKEPSTSTPAVDCDPH